LQVLSQGFEYGVLTLRYLPDFLPFVPLFSLSCDAVNLGEMFVSFLLFRFPVSAVAARAMKKLRATRTYLLMTKVKFHSSAFIAGKILYHPCFEVPCVCN
jgi:hypothetical protein